MNQPVKTARKLGVVMCTALVVGNMIGSGIFLLPAQLAPFGWNAVAAWVLTIAGGIALAFVFSQLARTYPKAGGPYAFTREAFGAAPAFLVAWSFWISIWVGNAAVATGAVSYLSVFFPSIASQQGLHAVITLTIIWLLTAVNCRGAFLAGGVQLVTTVLKVLPLIAVIALAAAVIAGGGGEAAPEFEFSALEFPAITAAATLTLWALLGLESATVPAEHVKEPERTIPRATMIGVILTGVIYLFTCSAVILLLPAEQVSSSDAPFADFVSRYWSAGAAQWIALFAAISGFGALNGWIMMQGELPYAMAKGGVFPRWLSVPSARGIPVRAHVVSSLLLSGVVFLNASKSMAELFGFLVLISTSASLVMYLFVSLSALRLRTAGRMPGGPVLAAIAIAAAIYALWAIYGAGVEAVSWYFLLLAAGAPVYFWARREGAPAF